MEVNTLVKHKKLNLGIGCISRVLKNSVKVNFGETSIKTCKAELLEKIDTSKCQTIDWDIIRRKIFLKEDDIPDIIIGNELKQWVGFGFVTKRVITLADLKNYQRVV